MIALVGIFQAIGGTNLLNLLTPTIRTEQSFAFGERKHGDHNTKSIDKGEIDI